MRSPKIARLLSLACCAGACSFSRPARAVVTYGGSGSNDTVAPNSVENYEGDFNGSFTGTIISSNFIVAAAHTFGSFTSAFTFNVGQANQTTYNMNVVATLDDLELWEIAPNQTGSFPSANIAPLYTGSSEVGASIIDVGRGFARGTAIAGHGWNWSTEGQGPFSWGTNTISAIPTDTSLGVSGTMGGDYLQYTFSANSSNPNECIDTEFDSGGGLFINVNGTYQLAGINSLVDLVATAPNVNDVLDASLYDEAGYWSQSASGAWFQVPETNPPTAESSYATRISSKQNFIGITDGSISKSNVAAAPISIDPSGQMVIFSNMTTGAIVGGGTLQVGYNGRTATLQIAPNSGASELSGLLLLSGGLDSTLDITNNHIIIDNAANSALQWQIIQYLQAGYNGGAWNGAGIVSSTAAASGGRYGVGFAEENELQVPGLSAGQAEIAYALYGDCNLDGVVNGIDFGIIAANFNKGFANDGWEDGDFDYNGVINGSDFALFAANFNKGASGTDIAALNAFAAQNNIILSVPEPAIASLLIAATATVGSRRRRRTKLLISSP